MISRWVTFLCAAYGVGTIAANLGAAQVPLWFTLPIIVALLWCIFMAALAYQSIENRLKRIHETLTCALKGKGNDYTVYTFRKAGEPVGPASWYHGSGD